MSPKFHIGDKVLFHGGLFIITGVNPWNDMGSYFTYNIGSISNVAENQLKMADWRDITKITKGRTTNV